MEKQWPSNERFHAKKKMIPIAIARRNNIHQNITSYYISKHQLTVIITSDCVAIKNSSEI